MLEIRALGRRSGQFETVNARAEPHTWTLIGTMLRIMSRRLMCKP